MGSLLCSPFQPLLLPLVATRVVIHPGPAIHEGDPASLACEDVSAPSEAVYTWYKNSKWLSEGSVASLRLQAVTAGDTGSYTCQVLHGTGVRMSPPVSLQVLCESLHVTKRISSWAEGEPPLQQWAVRSTFLSRMDTT